MVNFQIKLYKLLRYLVITPWYKKISRDNSFGWRKKKKRRVQVIHSFEPRRFIEHVVKRNVFSRDVPLRHEEPEVVG